MKINLGRVLLGGLVAGLLLSIGEYVLNDVVLGGQMKDFFSGHNFPPPSRKFLPIAIAVTFGLGILIVWLYALIRPRLGPGPKAAIVAAIVAWLGIYVYTGTINGLLFAIPLNTMLFVAAWGLIEYVLGALVGAALYQEP
jgi:hypothetical protein